MGYTHIVFDIDGTLLDTEEANLLSLQDVIREILHVEVPVSELRFALGVPNHVVLQQLNVEDIASADLLLQQAFSRYSNSTTKLFEGIPETLDELSCRSCSLGILTSRTSAEYFGDFASFGVAHCFKTVVCADDTVNHKPHPDPMFKFLEKSKADAEKILFIGDTMHDMNCAKGANVDFALALWGCKDPEGIDAKYYLSDPREIIALL